MLNSYIIHFTLTLVHDAILMLYILPILSNRNYMIIEKHLHFSHTILLPFHPTYNNHSHITLIPYFIL